MKKINIPRIIVSTLFFPFVVSVIVWRKGKTNISKILATGFTIAVTLPIWLAFLLIGYNVLSGKYSNDQKPLPTQKTCPESTSSAYYSHKNIGTLEHDLGVINTSIASLSALMKDLEQANPPAKYQPETYEQFQAGILKLRPNTDLVKHDALIRQNYQTYLDNLDTTWKQDVATFNQSKQTKLRNGEVGINVFKEVAKLYEGLLVKLNNCEIVSADEINLQIKQLIATEKALKE